MTDSLRLLPGSRPGSYCRFLLRASLPVVVERVAHRDGAAPVISRTEIGVFEGDLRWKEEVGVEAAVARRDGDLRVVRCGRSSHGLRGDNYALLGEIIFYGRLADDDLKKLYRSSHLLVVPSQYEGFGIVYLEGMAYGLPAIATNAGAAGEMINDGGNGFLIAPGDAGAMSRLIVELHADRSRLGRMGLAAYHRYLAHPTWEMSMAQVRGFLRDLAVERLDSRIT